LGPAWDTFFYIELGKHRLNYLLSLGLDKIDYNYYEQIFSGVYLTIAAFILNIFPKTFEIEVFYIINFLASIVTTIGVYKLTKILFNKKVGYINAITFLYYSIFFGHASINDRDAITVLCNIWITYYVLEYLKFNQLKNKKYVIYISLLLSIGLGIRFHFIATLIPLFLFTMFKFYSLKKSHKKNLSIDLVKILLITFVIVFIFWAPVHEDIFSKPYEIIKILLERSYGWAAILLNGKIYESNNYPLTYIFQNLFFKSPEYVIFLYILFFPLFITIRKFFKKNNNNFDQNLLFIILNIFFPTILLFLFETTVYDGLRLFLYILPYFLVIPAIVFYFLIRKGKNIFFKSCMIASTILFVYYMYNFFLLTPYHYTYLNIFSGKFSESDNKFENDYWGVSLKELIGGIAKNQELNNYKFIKFSICGVSNGIIKYNLNKIEPKINYKIVRDEENPDFVIMTNRVVQTKNENNKIYKTCFKNYEGKIVAEVKRRNLILSAIKKYTK
tara:strand:+ start:1521 stop:3023 length:1503 start_codon:yes stop_codon:yes gene_type:complete